MIFRRRRARSRNAETRSFEGVETDGLAEDDAGPKWPTLDLFQDLSTRDIEALAASLEPRRYADGKVILREGDEGDSMYLLDAGQVKVEKEPGEGRPRFTRVLQAPTALGEMALIARTPRTATVRAHGPVRCMRLGRDQFEDLVRHHPEVARLLTRMVGRRLQEIDGIRRVGKYRVVGTLGKGAVAAVFEARHPELGQSVALKMLSHDLVHHPQFGKQFDREARLVAGLTHPNIVRVFDFERAYGTRFIVMEKLEGTLLAEVIERGEQLAWGFIRQIIRETASALHYAHGEGLIHRDVKPSNIFVTRSGQSKLLDFGIAVHQERSSAGPEARVGSPCYVAPEQILGRQLDGRADLYALGISAFEMVTGQVPFDAPDVVALLRKQLHSPLPDPRLFVPEVPDDLVTFIYGACAKRPEERYASCIDALRVLEGAEDGPVPPVGEQWALTIDYPAAVAAEVEETLTALNVALAGLPGVSVRLEKR